MCTSQSYFIEKIDLQFQLDPQCFPLRIVLLLFEHQASGSSCTEAFMRLENDWVFRAVQEKQKKTFTIIE